MRKLNLGRPTAKQAQFINARTRYVAYGGARGGGKSWVVRVESVLLSLKFPGMKSLIVRKSYQELLNNHINPLREMLHGVASYNKTEKIFTFPNGSTIKFGYCSTDSDLDQYQGSEHDAIFLEEVTNLREEWIKKICACCRGVNGFPKRIYMTCNPGGVSHAYIKRLFVSKTYEAGENPDDYTFIQALVTDNKALMASQPDYIRFLDNLPPALRSAWRDGDWNIFMGQYFETFRDDPEHYEDRRWTHVVKPFKIRKHWPIYRSFDFGYRRPFATGYYTITDDGVMVRICEFYGCVKSNGQSVPNTGLKWPPNRIFEEMARFESEHPLLQGREIQGIADPAIWKAESGESVAETAMKHGIFFRPGDHERITGWMQCQYRLMFDDNGYPMFYVFNTCRDFIRTIPTLIYDEHKPEDLDTDGEDHIADEWRYMCMARPITPVLEQEEYKPMFGSDPLNQFTKE